MLNYATNELLFGVAEVRGRNSCTQTTRYALACTLEQLSTPQLLKSLRNRLNTRNKLVRTVLLPPIILAGGVRGYYIVGNPPKRAR